MRLTMRLRGVFVWHSVLVSLLGANQALVSSPIRWAGFSSRQFVLSPWTASDRMFVPPQALKVWDQPATMSSGDIPYFTPKPDKTIAWDAMNLCMEAGGDDNGGVVSVNRCTGGPDQSWDILPSWRRRANLVQLRGTNKCMAINFPKDAPGPSSLNGAMVKLQECDDHDEQDLWDLDWIPPPAQGFAPISTRSPSVRWITVCAMSIVGLSAWSLIAYSRHRKTKVRMVTPRDDGGLLDGSQGGVCLSAVSMDAGAPRIVPAAMTVGPEWANSFSNNDTQQSKPSDSSPPSPNYERNPILNPPEQGVRVRQMLAESGKNGTSGVLWIIPVGLAAIFAVVLFFSSSSPAMSEDLQNMVSLSTPIATAASNDRPAVIEFFTPENKDCNEAASGLVALEKRATRDGTSWVMVNMNNKDAAKKMKKEYKVDELPQFEFLGADGKRRLDPIKGGPVNIEEVMRRTAKLGEALPGDVQRGDRVRLLVDWEDEIGTVNKGEVGVVVDEAFPIEVPRKLVVNFETRKNVKVFPGDFTRVKGTNELAKLLIFPQ